MFHGPAPLTPDPAEVEPTPPSRAARRARRLWDDQRGEGVISAAIAEWTQLHP